MRYTYIYPPWKSKVQYHVEVYGINYGTIPVNLKWFYRIRLGDKEVYKATSIHTSAAAAKAAAIRWLRKNIYRTLK